MSETNEVPAWMKWSPTTIANPETPPQDFNAEPIIKETFTSGTFVKEKLYIGNTSTTPRGIMLKKGMVILQPYEVREVPEKDEAEVRSLFKTKALQALVDNGYLQIGNSPIVQVKAQPTPKPPADMSAGVPIPSGSGEAIAGTSTNQIGGTASMKLDSTIMTDVK